MNYDAVEYHTMDMVDEHETMAHQRHFDNERHPMRKAEADIAMLRSALAGLIGADTEDELRNMEAMMRLLPAPEADKAVSINAIHALLSTIPGNP